MKGVKNIILDLGGVLIDIDYNKTADAFKKLGAERFDDLYSQTGAEKLFEDLETGKISENDFYKEMQQHCYPGTTYSQIEAAWNEILLDFRIPSLDYLETLKEKYNLFLLSNTNEIHKKSFDKTLHNETGKESLDEYFIKSYYSHILHMRKPYVATYEFVLHDGNMKAGETLFIDDSIVNIHGANDAGLKTHLLLPAEKIERLGL